jgi:hypothetical protein
MRNQLSRFSNVGHQNGGGRRVPESYRCRNGANAVARIARSARKGPAVRRINGLRSGLRRGFWNTGKPVTGRRVGTDTHMVEANRDPEEVLREALRVLLRYVRETPELGHWYEVLPGILHRP